MFSRTAIYEFYDYRLMIDHIVIAVPDAANHSFNETVKVIRHRSSRWFYGWIITGVVTITLESYLIFSWQ